MKHLVLFLSLLLATAATRASAGEISESRTLAPFNSIKVSNGIEVIYTQEPQKPLKVKTKSELMSHLLTVVDANVLTITFDQTMSSSLQLTKCEAKVYVSAPTLQNVSVAGAAEFEAKGFVLVQGNFEVITSSAASVEFSQLTVGKMFINAASASKVEIGLLNAADVTLSATSAAKVDIDDINCNQLFVNATAAAKVDLRGNAIKADYKAATCAKIDAKNLKAGIVSADAVSEASIKAEGQKTDKTESSGGAVKAKKKVRF